MFKNFGLGEVVVALTPIVLYLSFCHLIGKTADKKGNSYVGFFFISFILTPIVGLILILLLTPKNTNNTYGNN